MRRGRPSPHRVIVGLLRPGREVPTGGSHCPASDGLGRGAARPPSRSELASPEREVDGGNPLDSRVRFAVIGDFGLDGESEAKVADLVTSWNPDFVITTGDNNYFQGAASTIDQNIGKYYCQFIGNYLIPDSAPPYRRAESNKLRNAHSGEITTI
jgi:hypothetical protein